MNKKGLGYPVCLASNQNVPTCTYMICYTTLLYLLISPIQGTVMKGWGKNLTLLSFIGGTPRRQQINTKTK
jgi:hypothetical protein